MSRVRLYLTIAALIGPSILGSASARAGARCLGTNVAANALIEIGKEEQKSSAQDQDEGNDKAGQIGNPVVVLETDLVANLPQLTDRNGILHAPFVLDPNLVNPWGLTESSGSPFWVSNNNAGMSTLYLVPGANNTAVSIASLVVSIPSPLDPLTPTGTPTGAVFNVAGPPTFQISGLAKNGTANSAPAIFIFATEDGTIVGW